MKKIVIYFLIIFALPISAVAADNQWWKSSIIYKDAKEPYRDYEANFFAFNKNYSNKKILISGKVKDFGVGSYGEVGAALVLTLMDVERKRFMTPYITLSNDFDAYIQNSELDFADINKGDTLFTLCHEFKHFNDSILGRCQAVSLFRNGKQIWLTNNTEIKKEVLK